MRTIAVALGLGLMLASPLAASEQSANPAAFDIPAGTLADALDVFGEQSGLQVVYDHGLVDGKRAAPIAGAMPPQEALERLVAGAGLDWELVNGNTVALRRGVAKDAEDGSPPGPFGPMPPALPALEHVVVVGDPRRVLPGEPSSASLGFAKPLLETPRSVSVIRQETIDLFGLSAVEDLVRVVPGVYTPTRFGIQGSVDVRGVPADTYFRGMKRLNLQGHARSVLAATDVIEIVRGPPAPIYGMGKIGGYTNALPKSSRAANGAYLDETHGFARAIRGAYGRDELSFGLGGPLALREQPAGYYVYALLERSGSYAEQVPIAQDLLQVAFTADDFIGPFRLETGLNYQRSVTAGALLNRVTQALVDDGRYVRGSPLVDLDANGNGKIGYLEMHAGSPVAGALGEENLPLRQWWSWPTDAAGEPLALGEFPIVPGIPQSMYDYLVAHPDADPGGLLRAQGVGGPAPISGHVPIGMVLDPRTVEAGVLDARRTGAFERELEAEFVVAFFDLVYDEDPGFTVKNQLFLDSMDQYKLSEQPGGGKQDVRVIEDKLTVTRRLRRAPEWLDANALASANARATRATGYRYGGDFGSHRTDAMSGDGRMTANTTFAHPFENDSLERDGAPWTSNYRSDYWELGVGAMLDLGILERTNVLVGARFDRSRAKNVEYAGTLDPLVGSAAEPGALRAADRRARRYDSGVSWHASVSRRMRGGLRPYVTVAESSLTLESNNNRMPNGVIEHGHIGSARLREIGLKGAWLGGKMFFATALYEQSRIGVVEDEDPAILEAEASATTAQGWETELKWVPSPSFALSVYALRHRTRFEPNRGAALLVDARALGFADVLDAEGNVVYPAEAFLYGGRSFLVLPDGIERYALKQGNPESQFGLTVQYRRPGGLGFTLGANVFSSVHAGRLQIVRLPGARVLNAGMFWEADRWHVQLDLLNALDERYFRARTGDTLSDTLVSAMPPRNWQLTAQLKF